MKLIYLSFVILLFIQACGDDENTNKMTASGSIESKDVTLSAKVAGEIKEILIDEGERVVEGDTVMIIDSELLSYQLQQALAGVKIAEAQLNLLKTGAREEDIAQAEQFLKQAEINYNSAQKDQERVERLYKEGSVTQKQFDDANARAEALYAQLISAKENLNKLKNFARPEELRQAEANLEKQKAAVKILEKNIRDCYITSPVDGFIVNKFVENGETITQLSSLFKAADLSNVELIIYVSEADLGKVKLGQKADVKSDTYKNKIYRGVITYISPEAEFTPKNIQTKDERTKLVFA